MSRATFQSGDKAVSADQFVPKSSQAVPVVIALHGSGGPPEDGGAEYAKALAGQSYIVIAPRYFERTGHTWAAPQEIEPNFKTWMDTVQDGMTYALSLPNNNGKVALLGFSLGAYLALSVAAIDQRVGAVVDFFGGLPEVLAAQLTHMPAVLILHGEQDDTVPISEAYKLKSLFDEKKIAHEMKTYADAGHSFHGADMMDAAQRTLAFLEKHIR